MSLRIYHTSDLHDHRGIATSLQALRARDPGLLFDSGDSLRGSQTVFHRCEPIIAELNSAGYDAQGVGNREFHYLFGLMRARARMMRHPLVCSNLIDLRGRTLPFVDGLTLEVPDAGKTSWTVRLFSLLVVQYPEGSWWERLFGWRFLDPVAVAERIAGQTPPEHVLVLLSHMGLSMDRKIAARVPRIDLLLGGHSHDTLHEPEYVGRVPIVHAGPYGRYVSRTELARGEDGRMHIERSGLLALA
ncbi:MAG TPA: hypothetical protein VGZ00_10040 [Candidatus Baltobacteraceae bacterium]|jgi:2',3'-cyclic-nucleotide 2'-phosphodiesterase (5'-nucleotidase family)|nr:hypothetical protein [Candidatus Baltobacteraceae bacterium]